MKFTPLPIQGAFVVDLERREDHRGFFARIFCVNEFRAHGMVADIVQINMSFNHKAGTVRGLHYQIEPAPEAKFIRCVHGAVFDVMVDLRPDSPTYLRWCGVELTDENRRAVFVPPLCLHGYQALTDGATVIYSASAPYTPSAERGFRPDDPAFAIQWPLPIGALSEKEKSWPPFSSLTHPTEGQNDHR